MPPYYTLLMCKINDLLFFVNFYSRLVAGSEKMKEKVGWVPAYPGLETIIETAWRRHRNHTEGYGDVR